uniref:Crp/Fnr family transcriptional regulator n=1 Tax=Fervidobacterium nodosum TaxID=2424 RepID=A0A7C5U484_9BACT
MEELKSSTSNKLLKERDIMDLVTFPGGTVLYNLGEIPKKVYYIVEGAVSVRVSRKELALESGTLGEWAFFELPSEEFVTVQSPGATFYVFNPDEIFQLENRETILRRMIGSISKRLLLIDSELAECQVLPEYVGPDRMRYFKRIHPNSMKLDDRIFQELFNVKRFYASGYYKDASDIVVKLMQEPVPEELKKEIIVWYTLLTVILQPENAELHFRRLNPKDYSDSLSYAYLYSFIHGGQKQEILEMFMKGGILLPSYTIVTLEGESAHEGYLVVRGYLKAVKLYEDKEVLLSIVQPGEFVGESALIESKTRMVTLYSISPAAVIPVTCEGIEKFIQSNPKFVLKICESQLKRIRQVKELLNLKTMPNPIQRVIMAIKYFENLFAKVKISAKDIANLVDVPVEKVMEELRHKGFKIAVDGTIYL